MVNLERWITGFGIQSPQRLPVAMMCISMKPSFMQNQRRPGEIRRVVFQEAGPSTFGQQGRAQDEPVLTRVE